MVEGKDMGCVVVLIGQRIESGLCLGMRASERESAIAIEHKNERARAQMK